MPDSTATSEGSAYQSASDFHKLWNGNSQAAQKLTQFAAEMFESATESSREAIDFLEARIRANQEAWEALIACRGPDQLMECERTYVERATTQYLEQTRKLTTRLSGLAGKFLIMMRTS